MDAVGYVYDKATGQTLPGVSIAARNIQGQYTNQGTTTDARGFFNFPNVVAGHTLEFRMIGYATQFPLLRDFGDGPLNKVDMEPTQYQMPEIVATAERTYYWAYYLAAFLLIAGGVYYYSKK